MSKVYNVQSILSKNKNNKLYKIFSTVKSCSSFIHNLVPELRIPHSVTAVLSLGLKFSFPQKPNFKLISESVNEAIRKLCWTAHYHGNKKELTHIDRALIKIRKDVNRDAKKFHCQLEPILFPEKEVLIDELVNMLRGMSHTPDIIYQQLIKQFRVYQQQNNIVIIQADKNAGICIIARDDYKKEVMRQLEDLHTYNPTTDFYFNLKMDYLRDEIRAFSSRFPEQLRLKSLLPTTHKPASFYVLPKVHKPFKGIPKGRPISSTINTLNRGISRLLDSILQPVMNFVPDMILDCPLPAPASEFEVRSLEKIHARYC